MSNFMLKFPERLKELMFDKGLTPIVLANDLKVSNNYITRYLQGSHLPSYSIFVNLIDILQKSKT